MAVGKSAAGKTSFKKRLTGEEIDEEHLVTNALDTDLCTIDITNVSLAWEIHAKQRTDLLEDEITMKIKEFVKDQSIEKTRRHKQCQNTNANLTSKGEIGEGRKRRKKESRLVRFFSRFGGKKEKDLKINTSSSHRKDEVAINERKQKTILPLEDRFRLEMITKPGRSRDITSTKKTDHSLIKVWDFGGQKVYCILHTVFLRVSCVYVLVVDLSAEINGSAQSDPMTTEPDFESFEYWLNTILSHMRKGAQNVGKGNVIVVGTHIDKLHPDKVQQKTMAETYFKQLKCKLQTKQHKNLVVSFFAVDNIDGDHETYGKIRETLLDAVKANCHWGEMRPIRYLQMTQRLQLLQEDTSSQLKGNLVPLSDVMEMAKKYNINTEKDVKAYLGFSHLVGDVTYFDTPGLQHFVIPNPQWLCNVFRAIITVDQFYPNDKFPESEVYALTMLKKNGMLDRKGPLLPLLWESFLYEEEPLYANLPPRRKDEPLQEMAVEYLLKLMIQFDLIVPLSDEGCLVPCLLPLSTRSLPQGFPDMGRINPPLFLVFHSSLESHKSFQLSLETGDEFLPHGFFHHLISRCVKQKWKWTGEKSQNVAYFLVDECMIRLSTRSTWIKIEAWFPAGSLAVPSKYYNEIKAAVDSLIDTYTPNMWVELRVNPCENLEKECLQSIGITSLGGRAHLVRCEEHEKNVAKKQFDVWLQPIKCKIPEDSSTSKSHTGVVPDNVHHHQVPGLAMQSITDKSGMLQQRSGNTISENPTKAVKNKEQMVSIQIIAKAHAKNCVFRGKAHH